MAITSAQSFDQSRPGGIHRERLQPTLGGDGVEEDDLRTIRLVQPLRNRLRNLARREILTLDVDVTARARDLRDKEMLDLMDARRVGQ